MWDITKGDEDGDDVGIEVHHAVVWSEWHYSPPFRRPNDVLYGGTAQGWRGCRATDVLRRWKGLLAWSPSDGRSRTLGGLALAVDKLEEGGGCREGGIQRKNRRTKNQDGGHFGAAANWWTGGSCSRQRLEGSCHISQRAVASVGLYWRGFGSSTGAAIMAEISCSGAREPQGEVKQKNTPNT